MRPAELFVRTPLGTDLTITELDAAIEGLDADLPRLTKPFRTDEIAASLIALVGKSLSTVVTTAA